MPCFLLLGTPALATGLTHNLLTSRLHCQIQCISLSTGDKMAIYRLSPRFRPAGQTFLRARLEGSTAVKLGEGTHSMKRSLAALVAGTAVLAAAVPASAVTTITTANGLNWQIHDFAPPKLDTGSIRAITDNAFYGFGGIRVRVSGIPATDTTARFNGELMRGFNLGYDGDESFTTAQPVVLGGIAISRAVKVSKAGNYSRFLDTFANTSTRTITVDVAFGGSAGQNSGSAQSKVVDSSSGDTTIGADDSWVEVANPSPTGVSNRGPSAVVNGTQSGTGNFQRDPFGNPLPLTGLEANFYGYKNSLTLAPGQTRSLLRYVVAGRAEAAATAGQQVAAVKTGATTLASAPDIAGIPAGVGCTVANWAPLYDAATCAASPAPAVTPEQPTKLPVTTSGYDVFNKSITQLAADMKSGLTTSQAITRAYLDRIAAYDSGPFGFHAFITVSDTAMAQAKAADDRRAAGDTSELLGIPVAVKDLYDTKDMPTTDGSLAFEGWRPERDAGQVKRLRDAGAVIIGKTNLSRVRQLRVLQRFRLRHGLERVQAVQDVARLVRRVSGRDRAQPRRVRHGHADRRLALRAVDRRVPGRPARYRRHLLRRGRDAADVAAGLRGPDRPHHERHRPRPQRHHGDRSGRHRHGPRRRRPQAPGRLEDRA